MMNVRNIRLIFGREVLDQVRDRRTLFMVVVLPVLLYPLMGIGTAQMTAIFSEQPRTVVMLGANELPSPDLLEGQRFSSAWFRVPGDATKLNVIHDHPQAADEKPGDAQSLQTETLLADGRALRDLIAEKQSLESRLAEIKKNDITADVTGEEQSLQSLNRKLASQFERSQIQVLILIPAEFAHSLKKREQELVNRGSEVKSITVPPRPMIVLNSADEKSTIAFRRVKEVLQAWERSILEEQLRQSDLPATLTTPVNPSELDLADRKDISANVWSKILPALLVIMTLTGAFYPAVDLCAGEKERGTMETLLICPATRTEIVLGKFLTVLMFSMTTAIMNLISVGMTGKYMSSLAMGGGASRLGDLSMPPISSLVWVFVILIPLATLFSALCLSLATFAKSSKEGQYYLSPLLMATLGLMMFCLSPGVEMHPFFSVMPVIGPGLLLKGLLKATGPTRKSTCMQYPCWQHRLATVCWRSGGRPNNLEVKKYFSVRRNSLI